jgi:hypothetical protein
MLVTTKRMSRPFVVASIRAQARRSLVSGFSVEGQLSCSETPSLLGDQGQYRWLFRHAVLTRVGQHRLTRRLHDLQCPQGLREVT